MIVRSRFVGLALPTAIAGILAVAALFATPARASFQLGLQDAGFGAPPGSTSAQTAATALRGANASVIRIGVDWSAVVGHTTQVPAGFDPSNPGDRHYDWSAIDAAVRSAAALHVRVLLSLFRAPQWAEGPNRPPYTTPLTVYPGAWDPSPAAFATFAHAAAVRYGGGYPDPLHPGQALPRVPYWEIWNEENLPVYLAAPDPVAEYRSLLDAGYSAIKAADPGSLIVAGGLAPVSYAPPLTMTPLRFAARLLCVHRVGAAFRANRSCPQRAHFDVFAIHPYSLAATPTKHAYAYGDVLVADLGKVQSLVSAADRLHTVAPRTHHRIWVTEFAWFTDPPNTLVGDPPRVAARYVAYSLYEMWRSGVRLVIWQRVDDVPGADDPGGGLYTASGVPKLMFSAYEFPLVASVSHGSGFAWGRAPASGRRLVRVQRLRAGRWHTIATVLTAPDGTFEARFRARGDALYRARVVGGAVSLAYDSRPIPPRRTHLLKTG